MTSHADIRVSVESGFTLMEVAMVMVFLSLGALGALSLTISTARLEVENRETAVAAATARDVLEQIHATDFTEVFARFNNDPADDPGVAGTALGGSFTVRATDIDPAAGPMATQGVDGFEKFELDIEITFPTDGAGALREDGAPIIPGVAMDLNGDGVLDAGDHKDDYRYLPCTIEVSWVGSMGPRSLKIPHVLTNRMQKTANGN